MGEKKIASIIEEDCTINFVFDEWDEETNTPKPNRIKNIALDDGNSEDSHFLSSLDCIHNLFEGVRGHARKLEDVVKNPNEKFYYHIWFRHPLTNE